MAESLGTATLDLTTDDSKLRSGLATAESGALGSFGRMASGAAKMAVVVGGAFAAFEVGKFIKGSISAAADFQQTLNVLQTQSHATAGQMKEVSATAVKLGADVKLPATSALDAAKAMLELSKGGLTVKQSMAAARAVVLLSTAANIDNETSAKAVVQALAAFNLPAKDATKVVNDFAGAALSSSAEMSDITLGMQQAGAGFHALRVPIGDASTALAEMVKHGISGAVAGASLNVAMTRLAQADSIPKVKAELQKLNVHAFDAQGRFVGMSNFAAQFHGALEKLTPQQQLQAAATIGGTRGMKALLDVFGPGAKVFDDLRSQVTAAGQAQGIADAQTKGFNGAMSGLKSTLETLQIQIGTALLPVLSQFVRWLTSEIPAAVAFVTGAIDGLTAAYERHRTTIIAALEGARQAVVTGMQAIGTAIDFVRTSVIPAAQAAWTQYGPAITSALATAVSAVKTATAAIQTAIDFVRTTVIPAAMAAWAQYGPGIQKVFSDVVTIIKAAVVGIETTIRDLASFVQSNWGTIWGVIGPAVTAAWQVVRTAVVAGVKIITDTIHIFASVLKGDWSGAWNALKDLVSTALGAVVSIVGSILRGLAGTAKGLAEAIGKAIAAGVKTAVSDLAGLAGDLTGKIASALGQVAGWAIGSARQIGFAIADGILSGIGNLASRLTSALTGAVGGALGAVKGAFQIRSPSGVFRDEVGAPMAEGVILGFTTTMAAQGMKLADAVDSATKANAPKVEAAFKDWADRAQKSFDSAASGLGKKLDEQLAQSKASIDKWKASLTPAEVQLNTQKAVEQLVSLQTAVNKAWDALKALPAEQNKAMSDLIAQQQANMAQLTKTAQGAKDDALIAGARFNTALGQSIDDPLAAQIIYAQQVFDTAKKSFDAGLISQEEFVASSNQLDAVKLAASQDTNAMTLLDLYNTLQAANTAMTDAGAAVSTQISTDSAARLALQATFNQQTLDATAVKDAALKAMLDANLESVAATERADRDKRAGELNAALVARFNRIKEHFDNVVKETDASYAELARHASDGGTTLGNSLANAMRNTIPTIAAAAKAIAATIAQFLQLHSPSELGPLSTLDTWWKPFTPTLLKGMDTKLLTSTISGALDPNLSAGMKGSYATTGGATSGATGSRGGVVLNQTFQQTPANADPVAIGAVTSWSLDTLRT